MKYIIILLLVLLASCTTTKPEVKIVTVYEKQSVIKPNKISPVKLDKVEFEGAEVNGVSYILMTVPNYNILILNLELLKKYIKEQKDVINYYDEVVQ